MTITAAARAAPAMKEPAGLPRVHSRPARHNDFLDPYRGTALRSGSGGTAHMMGPGHDGPAAYSGGSRTRGCLAGYFAANDPMRVSLLTDRLMDGIL